MTPPQFDVIVVGGGVHGCGIARELALRGFSTLLVEQSDFGVGNHECVDEIDPWRPEVPRDGGVRAGSRGSPGTGGLAQERAAPRTLRRADHSDLPLFQPWESWAVRTGMVAYDLLSMGKSAPRSPDAVAARGYRTAARHRFGRSSRGRRVPRCACSNMRSVCVSRTSLTRNGMAPSFMNHVKASAFSVVDEKLESVQSDRRSNGCRSERLRARVVVSAAGPWAGDLAGLAGLGEVRVAQRQKGKSRGGLEHQRSPRVPAALRVDRGRAGSCHRSVAWNVRQSAARRFRSRGDPSQARIGRDETEYMIDSVNGVLARCGAHAG